MPNSITSYHYSQSVLDQIQANFDGFTCVDCDSQGLTQAAVALVIVPLEEEAGLILTRRKSTLRAHAGQWSFPGGRMDEGETPVETALRELDEEVNLRLSPSNLMGVLDSFATRSGYLINPVLFFADAKLADLVPNYDEVDSIHGISFTELARSDSPRLESIPQSEQPVLSMHYDGDFVYAPTAALLYQFREIALFGRITRVAHFEQPVFAWR